MRIRTVPRLGWVLFLAACAGMAVALCYILPPQPRWQTRLEKGEEVFAVEPVHGFILVRGEKGISALDLFSGCPLGLVVAGNDFTFSGEDRFSPDHRFHAVRFDNGRKIGVINALTLQTTVIDLPVEKGNDRFPLLTFSPDGDWLAVGIRDENYHPVKVVLVDLVAGKIAFETEEKSNFLEFVPEHNWIVCEKNRASLEQYSVSVWELRTGKKVHESPPFLVAWMESDKSYHYYPRQLAPGGRTLLACRQAAGGKVELVLWDVLKNRLQGPLPVEDLVKSLRGTNFSPDGKTLVLRASPDHKRLIFVNADSATIHKEHKLSAPATYTSFSTDSTLAVCGTEDSTMVFALPSGELLEKTARGDEDYWRFLEDLPIMYRIAFEGEKAHRLLIGEFTFHFRDWHTKRTVAYGPLLTDSCWPPYHQICSRLIFIRSGCNRSPGQIETFLRQWLPLGNLPTNQINCLDLASGGELGRLEFSSTPGFDFAEPHRLLVTWHSEQNGQQVAACWAVPFRPSWLWVLGPPLALVLLALAWRSRHRFLKIRTTRFALFLLSLSIISKIPLLQ